MRWLELTQKACGTEERKAHGTDAQRALEGLGLEVIEQLEQFVVVEALNRIQVLQAARGAQKDPLKPAFRTLQQDLEVQ